MLLYWKSWTDTTLGRIRQHFCRGKAANATTEVLRHFFLRFLDMEAEDLAPGKLFFFQNNVTSTG